MSGLLASWASTADLCAPCSPTDVVDEAAFEASLLKASEILYYFTRQKWPGVGTDIFRPCSRACSGSRWAGSVYEVASYGVGGGAAMLGAFGGGFTELPMYDRAQCGCGWQDRVTLPGFPVVSITTVTIDGVVVNPAKYRLDDQRDLVTVRAMAADPQWMFPACQRMDLPVTQPDTWQVEYKYGAAPPGAGVAAAATLGCELALACQPSESPGRKACRLPNRVQTIIRQGVTMAILDPLTLFDQGKTGLADVDMWTASVLYGDRWRPAAVYDSNTFRPRSRRTS